MYNEKIEQLIKAALADGMLTEKEMRYRGRAAADEGVPMTNYGTAIAALHGILRRSLSPFPDIQKELD